MKKSEHVFPQRLPVYQCDLRSPGIPAQVSLNHVLRPQYLYENHKSLGFLPLNDVFKGPIFGRFRGSRPFFTERITQLPSGQFILEKDLAESWIQVEYALTIISQHFYNPLVPLSSPIPPIPPIPPI